ncbi:hypothetical protein KC947_02040 [Candidatus Saccharibacteria bacterium]|nr:hypothetical protein [Candidatus Saccharibacteria bacterium]
MSTQKYKITNNKSLSSKKLVVVIVLILLILLLVGGYLYYRNKQKNNIAKDTAQITSAKTQIMNQDDNSSAEQANPTKTNNQVSDKTSDQIPATTTSSIKIISVDQSGGQITVDAETSGDSGGKCVFSFTTTEDKPVVREVLVSGNKCNTSIPEVEFTKLGTWSLTATYYVNDKKVETSQNVTIN